MSALFKTQPTFQDAPASDPHSVTAAERKAHKEQPRIRRRNRLITSCLECRRRKLKCDKQQPCTNCTKFVRDCLFITPALDPAGQAKLAEVKEKMGILERTLEQDVARRGNRANRSTSLFTSPSIPGQEDNLSDQEEDDDVKGLEPNTMSVEDAAYYEDDGNDDVVDLGIAMGKVRLTERVGGFVRPRFSEELTAALKEAPMKDIRNPFVRQSPESWMAPGRDYVAPSSSFFFAPGVHKTSLPTYLPAQGLVDRLMEHYWKAVHLIARTVHRPSFERQYARFWNDYYAGIEPRVSFQAVLFATLLSSTISMSEEKIMADFDLDKTDLLENFKQGTESALARAYFLRTTKLETLQAFVMYLIPLCRAEISREHSALTGTCIRLAECMGLHRDPTNYTTEPVEIHIRRLIWHQICFLDLRTCETTGPRPQIRRDEHDTEYPLNIDDVDIDQGVNVTENRTYFTDMTITRMRFECYEMQRQLWIERPKLEAKKTTLTAVLGKIQRFGEAMKKTYLPLFSKTHPLHVLAMHIYGILSNRMYIMVLQKFMSNEHRVMPERLRQLTISTGVMIIEHSMAIEQTPALADWSWYLGALNQYHAALCLLSELYAREPEPEVEAQVWKCLDFVFGLPADLSGTEKTFMVLQELRDRTEAYANLRRIRAPRKMEEPKPRTYVKTRTQQTGDAALRSGSIHSLGSAFSASTGSSPQDPRDQPSPNHSQNQQHQPTQIQHPANPPVQTHTHNHQQEALQQPQPQPQPQPHTHHPHHLQHQPSHTTVQQPPPYQPRISNLSHVPQVDYTSPYGLTMTAGSNRSVLPTAAQTLGFTAFPTAHQVPSTPTSMPPPPMLANTSGVSMHPTQAIRETAAGPAMGPGGGPMDAMPDIDWSEFDQMFATAEMSSSMLIPPYTFPRLSPNDLELQWPTEGMQ